MQLATFEGRHDSGLWRIGVLGRGPYTFLDERRDLCRYSRYGFAWGENSDGARQAALALLAAVLGPFYARALVDIFARDVVAVLPLEHWVLTEEDICRWFEALVPTVAGQVALGRMRSVVP